MSQPPGIPEKRAKSKGKGCLIGCLVALVIGIALLAGTGFFLYNLGGSLIEKITDEAPVQLPTTVIPEEQQTELEERVETFAAAFEEPSESASIELKPQLIASL